MLSNTYEAFEEKLNTHTNTQNSTTSYQYHSGEPVSDRMIPQIRYRNSIFLYNYSQSYAYLTPNHFSL
jgi:hypothetical protein